MCKLKRWPVHKNIFQDSNSTADSDEKLKVKAYNNSRQGNNKYTKYHY